MASSPGGRKTLCKQVRAASTGDYGLVHGTLHLFNSLDGGPARGLVAIDPRSSYGTEHGTRST
jgi:streptomycin 6-kinase